MPISARGHRTEPPRDGSCRSNNAKPTLPRPGPAVPRWAGRPWQRRARLPGLSLPPSLTVPLCVQAQSTPTSASCQEEQQTFLRLTGAKSAAEQPPDERGVAQARRTLRLSVGQRGVVPALRSCRSGFGPGPRLGCNPHPAGERSTMWKGSRARPHPLPFPRNLRFQAPLGATSPPARTQGCLTMQCDGSVFEIVAGVGGSRTHPGRR